MVHISEIHNLKFKGYFAKKTSGKKKQLNLNIPLSIVTLLSIPIFFLFGCPLKLDPLDLIFDLIPSPATPPFSRLGWDPRVPERPT